MIERIVGFAVRAPVVMFIFAIALMSAGLWSYKELDIEAYPNPVPPLVEIITQPNGWSAEEVERYVTVPLEIGLEVRVSNPGARRFYRMLGYQEIGLLQGYYCGVEAAVGMKRALLVSPAMPPREQFSVWPIAR